MTLYEESSQHSSVLLDDVEFPSLEKIDFSSDKAEFSDEAAYKVYEGIAASDNSLTESNHSTNEADPYQIKLSEKSHRADRIGYSQTEKNKRHAQKETRRIRALGPNSPSSANRDLPQRRFVTAWNSKKQPRMDKWRRWQPKSQAYRESQVVTPCFHDVRLTSELPARFPPDRIPYTHDKYSRVLHQIYFLVEPYRAGSEAIKLLQRFGILDASRADENEPLIWSPARSGGDRSGGATRGHYYSTYSATNETVEFIYRNDYTFDISAETARQLYHVSGNNREAHARLMALGLLSYKAEKVTTVESGAGPIEEMTGLDPADISPAIIRGYHSKGGGEKIRRATILRRGDLNKDRFADDPERRRRKKPYSWKSRRQVTRYQGATTKILDNDKKIRNKAGKADGKAKKFVLAEHAKYVTSYGSLYRACKYIFTGAAKSQSFIVQDDKLADGVKEILGYVQSRYDRRLFLDINEVIQRKNPVVDGRLRRWESEKGIEEPVDFVRVWRTAKRQSTNVQPGHDDTKTISTIPVSPGYLRQPQRYVTTESELLTAVRGVLQGSIKPDYFNVIDPRTAIILDYCMELRAVCFDASGNYSGPNPNSIAQGQVPELRQRLKKADLSSFASFSFGNLTSAVVERSRG